MGKHSDRGVWPEPQYPPVTCAECGLTVPEQEAAWGYCYPCFERVDPLG